MRKRKIPWQWGAVIGGGSAILANALSKTLVPWAFSNLNWADPSETTQWVIKLALAFVIAVTGFHILEYYRGRNEPSDEEFD